MFFLNVMLQYITLTPSYANLSYAMFSGQSRGRISGYCCTVVKSKGKISQNFVAFSEYMNFKLRNKNNLNRRDFD